jgi:hypothetical protein
VPGRGLLGNYFLGGGLEGIGEGRKGGRLNCVHRSHSCHRDGPRDSLAGLGERELEGVIWMRWLEVAKLDPARLENRRTHPFRLPVFSEWSRRGGRVEPRHTQDHSSILFLTKFRLQPGCPHSLYRT